MIPKFCPYCGSERIFPLMSTLTPIPNYNCPECGKWMRIKILDSVDDWEKVE